MRIVMTNQKGGVGKTTLVFHLATLFANDRKSVLVIDLDPQGNLTSCFLRSDLPPQNNIALVCEDKRPEPITVADHLDLVGTDSSLSRYENHDPMDHLEAIGSWLDTTAGYDVTILDTPPSMGLFTRGALLASDFAIIPADVSWFALKGLADLVKSIEILRASHQTSIRLLGIVLNNVQERQSFAQETWAVLDDQYGYLLFKTTIPESVRVREATSQGIPVTRLNPRGKAAEAYRQLYKEIVSRLQTV
ncbi:MAG: ParA family protein [Candidatus Cryosericum sp.]|nr:ParA family protein [bacterium]